MKLFQNGVRVTVRWCGKPARSIRLTVKNVTLSAAQLVLDPIALTLAHLSPPPSQAIHNASRTFTLWHDPIHGAFTRGAQK